MKKVRLKELMEIARNERLTVAVFYDKGSSVCKNQINGLERIEEKIKEFGVVFVKLKLSTFYKDIKKLKKGDPNRKWSVDVVPTIMMWLKGGINVLYQFEPNGKFFSQINGYQNPVLLFKKIAGLLREYS